MILLLYQESVFLVKAGNFVVTYSTYYHGKYIGSYPKLSSIPTLPQFNIFMDSDRSPPIREKTVMPSLRLHRNREFHTHCWTWPDCRFHYPLHPLHHRFFWRGMLEMTFLAIHICITHVSVLVKVIAYSAYCPYSCIMFKKQTRTVVHQNTVLQSIIVTYHLIILTCSSKSKPTSSTISQVYIPYP